MASSSACLAAATRAWLAAAPTRGPAALAALVGPLVCSARALSSSAAASSAAGGGGAAAAPGTPDAFTAALQQKTEEELRQLALQQGQPHVAEASSTAGDQQQQGSAPSEEALPPHGKREIGGYAGPEPTRYADWEIKGRCSDF